MFLLGNNSIARCFRLTADPDVRDCLVCPETQELRMIGIDREGPRAKLAFMKSGSRFYGSQTMRYLVQSRSQASEQGRYGRERHACSSTRSAGQRLVAALTFCFRRSRSVVSPGSLCDRRLVTSLDGARLPPLRPPSGGALSPWTAYGQCGTRSVSNCFELWPDPAAREGKFSAFLKLRRLRMSKIGHNFGQGNCDA